MPYSREHPSQRYRDLIALYTSMHRAGDPAHGVAPEQTFDGRSLPPQALRIRKMIARTGARTILDYGCGKGMQYRVPVPLDGRIFNSIQEYWGVESIRCYDPGYEPFSKLPDGVFDGVVCTDVLEHCPEQDLEWIIEGLFSFARKFVFANVACYPARKTLPNGENAHCTIRPGNYWEALFEQAAARFPGMLWQVWIDERNAQGQKESSVGNFIEDPVAPTPASGPRVWRMV